MWFVFACVALSVMMLGPKPEYKRWSFPPRVGDVDQAVILDIARAGLMAGLSLPTTLAAVHHALDDQAICARKNIRRRMKARRTRERSRTLNEVANSLLLGAEWDEAWANVDARFLRIQSALEPAWKHGVAPVPLLERSAYTLRLSRQRRAKEAAARLGAKLVIPLGVCFLPAFMLIGVLPVVVGTAQILMP